VRIYQNVGYCRNMGSFVEGAGETLNVVETNKKQDSKGF
jgi:hypothetical protein